MFLILYIIGGIAFIFWMFSKSDGTEMNNGLGSFLVLLFVTLIYSLVWPIIWPITYFQTKKTVDEKHASEKFPSLIATPSINSDDELVVNYSDQRSAPTIKNDIKKIAPKLTENITPIKFPKNNITENKPNDANRIKIDASKESSILEMQKSSESIKKSPSKEVETLSKGTKPTAYQCLKCFYKWNRDPNLRCAMCSEVGPYKPHDGLLR